MAFRQVFQIRQTKHRLLLAWLDKQLKIVHKPCGRSWQLLAEVARRGNTVV